MAIALASLEDLSLWMTAVALAAVGVGITAGVYGAVALIVKLDDIGLHLAGRGSAPVRAVGRGLVHAVPPLLSALSGVGTAAMLWVGGGILLHGMEELGAPHIPHAIDAFGRSTSDAIVHWPAVTEWLIGALAAAVVALLVGAIVVVLLKLVRRPAPAGAAA